MILLGFSLKRAWMQTGNSQVGLKKKVYFKQKKSRMQGKKNLLRTGERSCTFLHQRREAWWPDQVTKLTFTSQLMWSDTGEQEPSASALTAAGKWLHQAPGESAEQEQTTPKKKTKKKPPRTLTAPWSKGIFSCIFFINFKKVTSHMCLATLS